MYFPKLTRAITDSLAIIVTFFAMSCTDNQRNSGNKGSGSDTGSKVEASHTPSDSSSGTVIHRVNADSATTRYLPRIANSGLAELAAAKVADRQGTDAAVKGFAQLMIHDHNDPEVQVKRLANKRDIILPTEPSQEYIDRLARVQKKQQKEFNKAFMDMIVEDNKNTIKLFETLSAESADSEIIDFINTFLPKMKIHQDFALSIQNKLKK